MKAIFHVFCFVKCNYMGDLSGLCFHKQKIEMKNVRIIPPKPKENRKLRVAAYCRVSTSGPEQLRSFETQISAYKKMIKSYPNWLFAGVFYDIESGLRRSGRKSLDKLLRKAAKGKIDYIITKSISRVSRDTLEVLKIIRFLRERGINMHFENEKLDSIEADIIHKDGSLEKINK